jgi:hypothetical protein
MTNDEGAMTNEHRAPKQLPEPVWQGPSLKCPCLKTEHRTPKTEN